MRAHEHLSGKPLSKSELLKISRSTPDRKKRVMDRISEIAHDLAGDNAGYKMLAEKLKRRLENDPNLKELLK